MKRPESFMPEKCKIVDTKPYTENVTLFRVKSSICPKPGQFFEVSIPGVGEAPLASTRCEDGYLDILARNAGNVTAALFKLKKGDDLWIRGPYGNGFPLDDLRGKNIILVGGGTGIAPITSMIDYIEKNRKEFGEIFIYLGFRDEEHVLLKERIATWQKKFQVHVGLSRDLDTHKYEVGFVQDVIDKHKPETHNTNALLCGPEPMMKSVTDELHKLKVFNNQIYWSMERRMECCFGSCGRCLIQDLYCCKDGPIFRYDEIKSRIENEEWSNSNG